MLAQNDPQDLRRQWNELQYLGNGNTASITRTLKILAGYTHSTVKLAGGNIATDAPEDVANIWLNQTFDMGDKQRLDIGLGGNYNSGFYVVDIPTTSVIYLSRSYLQVNARLGYSFGKNDLNLTINNLLDRVNFQPGATTASLPIDVHRSFRLTLTRRF